MPREPMFIRKNVVMAILDMASSRPASAVFAYLFLTPYIFLLRLPSEALGISFDGSEFRLVLEPR